jgi:hypothetical protein
VLWQFVAQQLMSDEVRWRSLSKAESGSVEDRRSISHTPPLPISNIRATFRAIAQQEERCALTGQVIAPQQPMRLGLSITGELIPLSTEQQVDS